MANVNPDEIIEIGGRRYKQAKVNIVIRCTQLCFEDGTPVKGVNQDVKDQLIKQGYDHIGFSTVGFWGKIDS